LPNSIERGRNCARGPSDSRPLGWLPPRLLLLPHHRATPTADIAVNLLVEQHQKETLSHRHGAFAGRAEEFARLQVFKILLSLRRSHQNRDPSSLSRLSHHHFAEILAQRQPRKGPPTTFSSSQQYRGCPAEGEKMFFASRTVNSFLRDRSLSFQGLGAWTWEPKGNPGKNLTERHSPASRKKWRGRASSSLRERGRRPEKTRSDCGVTVSRRSYFLESSRSKRPSTPSRVSLVLPLFNRIE